MNTTTSLEANAISWLLSTAQTRLNERRLDAAAECYERALGFEPSNVAALIGLATVSFHRQKLTDAKGYALRAVNILPNAPNLLLLAQISGALGDLEEAVTWYDAVVKIVPNHVPSLTATAEAYEEMGYRTRAITYYERALAANPKDYAVLSRLSKLYPFEDSGRLLAYYEQARPSKTDPLALRLGFQPQFVTRKEAAERAKRGLPSRALSHEDLYIRFAHDERDELESIVDAALAQDAMHPDGLICKGVCLLTRGDMKGAEQYFHAHAAHHANSIYDTIFLTEAFYEKLDDIDQAALLEGLPHVVDVTKQSFSQGAVIFLSCDINYFLKFARPLLSSLNDVAPGAQAHVHIMNGSDEQLKSAKLFCAGLKRITVAISAEDARQLTNTTAAAKHYFHAIRFVRMLQYLIAYQLPLWLMDVDALMHLDPRPILEADDNGDVMLLSHAGRLEPWSQFNASVVGIQPTPHGTKYLRLVAAYIRHFHLRTRLWWGIDQLALYGVYAYLKGNIKMLPPHMLEDDCGPAGVIWSNGTTVKFRQVKALAGTQNDLPDSPRVRYLSALKKYELPV